MPSHSRIQLENYLKTLDVKADRVLDIGGSQLPIKGRTKSWDVKDYKILDLEQPHEVKQKPNYTTDLNKSIPENIIVQNLSTKKDRFNLAFCLEVSEYWYNPLQALKNINYILDKGAILYISFHFEYPVHNPIEQDYLRYTFHGAMKLLAEAGFEKLDIIPRLYKADKLVQHQWYIEGMKPNRDYPKHNWQGCIIKAKKI